MRRAALTLLAVVECSIAFAQPRADGTAWIDSIHQATRRLNYTGIFVYQNGRQTETARIVHAADGANVHERIEILDGPPREIIRANDEVRCYSPATMSVKIERNVGQRPLLPLLTGGGKTIAEHYRIRLDGVERVAGHECQVLLLEPKDKLRYGHRLCAEISSRMTLRSQTFDVSREQVEGFAFKQIELGAVIPPEMLRSRYASTAREWRIEESNAIAVVPATTGWIVNGAPPGFERLAELKRRFRNAPDVSQIVLSDGVSAVSVFIEPAQGRSVAPSLGASRQGAVHAFTRKVDNHLITAVGDAPSECVQAIANGVVLRASQ